MVESSALVNPAASAIVASVHWIEALLAGSLASSLAIIAVALLGLRMLGGHVPLALTVRVILGCFILFGAPMIAVGIIDVSRGGPVVAAPEAVPAAPNLSKRPPVYDPYAGATTPIP